MKMEQSVPKRRHIIPRQLQLPGNYPEKSMQQNNLLAGRLKNGGWIPDRKRRFSHPQNPEYLWPICLRMLMVPEPFPSVRLE